LVTFDKNVFSVASNLLCGSSPFAPGGIAKYWWYAKNGASLKRDQL
jgi:hypothetical protein